MYLLNSVLHRYSTLRQFHNEIQSLLPRKFPEFPPKKYNKKSNFEDEYLRVRCIQFNQYFNSLLSIQSIRNLPSFQALFLPQTEMENIQIEEESSDEDYCLETNQEKYEVANNNNFADFRIFQDQFFQLIMEIFQIDYEAKLENKLFMYIDKYLLYFNVQ